jgi:dTMP kinase
MTFIVFEGVDGCGKTTQIKLLSQYIFENYLRDVLITREPTGEPIRKKLENLKSVNENKELLTTMFFEDRHIHTKNIIIPNINRDCVVLCDRYNLSTFVYQQAQGVAYEKLLEMEKNFSFLIPDLTILFISDIQETCERRKQSVEIFEQKMDFQKTVQKNYIECSLNTNRFGKILIIETQNKGIEEIHKEIVKNIKNVLYNFYQV